MLRIKAAFLCYLAREYSHNGLQTRTSAQSTDRFLLEGPWTFSQQTLCSIKRSIWIVVVLLSCLFVGEDVACSLHTTDDLNLTISHRGTEKIKTSFGRGCLVLLTSYFGGKFLAVLYTWQLCLQFKAFTKQCWGRKNNPRSLWRAQTKLNSKWFFHLAGETVKSLPISNKSFRIESKWIRGSDVCVFGCQRCEPADYPCSWRCPHSYLSDTHLSSAPVSSPSNSKIRLLSSPRVKIWPQSKGTNGAGKPLSRHLRWTKATMLCLTGNTKGLSLRRGTPRRL